MTIDKRKYPDIFVHNDDLCVEDRILFEEMSKKQLPQSARTFFEKMKIKEEEEFAPSADIVIDEHNNTGEIYLIRYYYSEYKIGRGLPEHRCTIAIYNDSLDATLKADLFPLLGRHVSFLSWLEENQFKCVDYNGNSIFHSANPTT